MKAYQRILISVSSVAFFLSIAWAQTNPNLEIGFKPYGAYDETEFDSVNIANGNLTLHIPLFDYPQRGDLKDQVRLIYNSKSWQVHFNCTQLSCLARWDLPSYPPNPIGVQLLSDPGSIMPILSTWKGVGGTIYTFSGQTSDGAIHQFAQTNVGGYESIDSTGTYFNDPGGVSGYINGNYVLLDRAGNAYNTVAPWSKQDTNGNYISESSSYWIDTLGRPLNPSALPGPNGGTRQVSVGTTMVNLNTHFNAKVIDPVTQTLINVSEYSGTAYLLGSVAVYDGVSWATSPTWTFQYNDTDGRTDGTNYGDITQVTLPTGATITYTWGTANVCQVSTTKKSRSVLSRTINANDGMGPQTTTYSGTVGIAAVKVTDPAGNDTVHQRTGLQGSCSLYDTEVDYYKGSSTVANPVLLKIVQTTYSSTPNPFDQYGDGSTTAANVVPTSVTTKYPIPNSTNYLVSQVQTDYDNSFTFYPGPVSGGTYGRITEEREYNYGLNNPGVLLRKTDYTYAAVSGSGYLTANLLDLVTQETVYNGSGSQVEQTNYSYDTGSLQGSGVTEQHTTTSGPRGNLTLVQEWLNTTGGLVTTKQTSYYDTGMPYQTTDLRNNLTTYSYSSANYGAYLTQTQYPNTGSPAVTHSISGGYDFNTGLLTSFTDQNGQVSNYGYDVLGRVTSASYPDGGSVGVSYTDTVPWQIQKTIAVTGSLNKVTNSAFDGLGRLSEAQSHDPDCQVGSQLIKVDSTYGNDTTQNTHYNTATTPYCDTPGTVFGLPSRTDSDTLGRTVKVTQTDGTLVLNSYAANSVGLTATATDEAGITRTSQTDGLGRLTTVWEDPNGKNYETDYSHDTLDNLISVTQKGDNSGNRNRSFTYDSLSRLTSAINPESGTITYIYSNSPTGACASSPGVVCTKTAPAANQTGTATATTTYTYDALDRLTSKTYAGVTTPAVYYGYDHDTSTLSSCATAPPPLTDPYPISYRTAMCDGSGATSWSHDKMGRILSEDRTIGTNTNTISYAYNLDGSLSTLTYPNTGKVITYTPNGSGGYTAGRPASAKDVAGAINYVTGATYAPQGALASLTNGGVIFGAFSYNTRLQPLQIFYGTNTPPALTSSTCPGTVGNIMHRVYNFGLGANDNGNVDSIANCRDTTRTASFTYDTLNRIKTAQSSGTGTTSWGEDYSTGIDPWGNLTNINAISGKANHEGLTCATANTKNQLNTCYSYDAAGNLWQNGAYTYDAENRLTVLSSPVWYYVYDGDGNRVEKCSSSSCPSNGTGTVYWRTVAGAVISETGLNGTVNHEYIFFNGQRVARRDLAGNTVHYYFSDHLGTHAVVMNAAGTQCEQDADYYPYGGVQNDYCTTPVAQNYKFNGKERDTESGLDEFGARYYGSMVGRFMTPDWAAKAVTVPYANFGNPQSLNLYTYVENNPTTMGDPDGHELIVDPTLQAWVDELRSQSTAFDEELKAHEGPYNTDLVIEPGESKPDPSGLPTSGSTNAPMSGGPAVDCSPNCVPIDIPYKLDFAIVTISDKIMGDKDSVEGTVEHEIGHVNHARTKPAEFQEESDYTRRTHGATQWGKRPEEIQAEKFKAEVERQRKEWRKNHKKKKKTERAMTSNPNVPGVPNASQNDNK